MVLFEDRVLNDLVADIVEVFLFDHHFLEVEPLVHDPHELFVEVLTAEDEHWLILLEVVVVFHFKGFGLVDGLEATVTLSEELVDLKLDFLGRVTHLLICLRFKLFVLTLL